MSVQSYAAGNKIYGFGRSNPTSGPVDPIGYRERDMQQNAMQSAIARRQPTTAPSVANPVAGRLPSPTPVPMASGLPAQHIASSATPTGAIVSNLAQQPQQYATPQMHSASAPPGYVDPAGHGMGGGIPGPVSAPGGAPMHPGAVATPGAAPGPPGAAPAGAAPAGVAAGPMPGAGPVPGAGLPTAASHMQQYADYLNAGNAYYNAYTNQNGPTGMLTNLTANDIKILTNGTAFDKNFTGSINAAGPTGQLLEYGSHNANHSENHVERYDPTKNYVTAAQDYRNNTTAWNAAHASGNTSSPSSYGGNSGGPSGANGGPPGAPGSFGLPGASGPNGGPPGINSMGDATYERNIADLAMQKGQAQRQYGDAINNLEGDTYSKQRDINIQAPHTYQDLLEHFAGRGMAHSGTYAVENGSAHDNVANQLADLSSKLNDGRNSLLGTLTGSNDNYNSRLAAEREALAQRLGSGVLGSGLGKIAGNSSTDYNNILKSIAGVGKSVGSPGRTGTTSTPGRTTTPSRAPFTPSRTPTKATGIRTPVAKAPTLGKKR